ncbi:MAG: TlyA family RNA methyltransferase [bacterium]|nr:TlyA family RNA methyltransferase [bacterium]
MMSYGARKVQKIRVDQLLVDRGFAETRIKAQALILSGAVRIGEVAFTKPGMKVAQTALITLADNRCPYVSRGGVKLESALSEFKIAVRNKVAIDIGASTGGFTDCLLQKGVKKVYAIDVGYGQFHAKLRPHPQVTVHERTNARYLKPVDFPERFDFAVIDVSFISLTKIIPAIVPLLKETGEIVALIKPQFEIPKPLLPLPSQGCHSREGGKSRGQKKKGGVVRDQTLRDTVVRDIAQFATNLGLAVVGVVPSVLTGPAGNQEYFIYLKKQIRISKSEIRNNQAK